MNSSVAFLASCILSFSSALAQLRAVREWTFIYDGPGHNIDLPADATLDRQGNLYITGRSGGVGSSQDIATIRISASGQEVLVLRYNSVNNSWDEGNSVAVDSNGNMFVAGTSAVTNIRTEIVLLKYSPAGSVLWKAHYSPDTLSSPTASTVRLDSFGNIYLGGTMNGRFLILKYNAAGNLIRSSTFGDDSTSHSFSSFQILDNERLVLAGSRSYWAGGDLPSVELAVMVADTQGNLQWKNHLGAQGVKKLQVDNEGNIILITHGDGTTAKYSKDGQLLWFRNPLNSDPSIMILTGLAIDSQNRIIVGGYDCAIACFHYAVMKYDTDGNVIWRRIYSSADTVRDFSLNLTVDHKDNIYLTGNSALSYSEDKCISLRFDSSGTLIWDAVYATAPGAIDIGELILVDDSGHVYIAGSSATSAGWDYLAIKYRQDFQTSVRELGDPFPSGYGLAQNFPNPFNPKTTITYAIPRAQPVSLRVYDLLGQEIATLAAGDQQAGVHSVEFDAGCLASGVYFYRLSTGTFTETKKLVVLR
jgi:hypothetical protein